MAETHANASAVRRDLVEAAKPYMAGNSPLPDGAVKDLITDLVVELICERDAIKRREQFLAEIADEAHSYLRGVSDGTSPICVPVLYEDQRVATAMDAARGDLFKAMRAVHLLLGELTGAGS
jgi:hypothetical protein